MKLKEAIKLAKKEKKKIKSQSLGMYSQTAKSLIYWIFSQGGPSNLDSICEVAKWLRTEDWELD